MSSFAFIALAVIIVVAIFAWYKKKKSNENNNPFWSMRKNKDEVWKTIKQFLKDNGEQGQEIVDSYVVKREHIDMINQNTSYLDRKNKQYEVKIRKWQRNEKNKELKAQGKKQIKAPAARDLFVVVFQTRDSKTGKLNNPRCFECEVVNTKISKKEYDRKILINRALDYDTEMEWIAPVRAAEEVKAQAIEKRLAKQKEAEKKRQMKKLARKEKKAKKNASKK